MGDLDKIFDLRPENVFFGDKGTYDVALLGDKPNIVFLISHSFAVMAKEEFEKIFEILKHVDGTVVLHRQDHTMTYRIKAYPATKMDLLRIKVSASMIGENIDAEIGLFGMLLEKEESFCSRKKQSSAR